jgi:hypothetical protein
MALKYNISSYSVTIYFPLMAEEPVSSVPSLCLYKD